MKNSAEIERKTAKIYQKFPGCSNFIIICIVCYIQVRWSVEQDILHW